MFTKGSNCFWFPHFDACFLSAHSHQTAFHHPFPYFTTFSRDSPLVSIERHPASSPTHLDIPPSLLSSMFFCQRFVLCTVFPHCILQRPPQRCVEQVEGLLDCYDDLTYKCFGQKIFLKINFLERFVAAIRFEQAVKQYLMSYSSSSFQLVTGALTFIFFSIRKLLQVYYPE